MPLRSHENPETFGSPGIRQGLVVAGEGRHAGIYVTSGECRGQLDCIERSQWVAGDGARRVLENPLRHGKHGEALLGIGLSEPVRFELLDKYGCIVYGKLAQAVFSPQRGGHLDAGKAGDDEVRSPPDDVGARLVRIELYQRGAIAEDAQPRASETRRERGVPVPAALRAVSTRRRSGRAVPERRCGLVRRPARSRRARVRADSVSSRSGFTAASRSATTQLLTLRPCASASAFTSRASPSSRRMVSCAMHS